MDTQTCGGGGRSHSSGRSSHSIRSQQLLLSLEDSQDKRSRVGNYQNCYCWTASLRSTYHSNLSVYLLFIPPPPDDIFHKDKDLDYVVHHSALTIWHLYIFIKSVKFLDEIQLHI